MVIKPQTNENLIYSKKKIYYYRHDKLLQDKINKNIYLENKLYRDKINRHWITATDKNGNMYKYNTITKYSKWI